MKLMNITKGKKTMCIKQAMCAAILLSVVITWPAGATLYQLDDRNSSAIIDDGSSQGVNSWVVDGTENLYQQWFWYRIGDQVGESSLDTLGPPTGVLHSNFDLDPGMERLALQYTGAGFVVSISFDLTGGLPGSGASDLAETITIDNLGSSPLDFHFFQYVDLDLVGAPSSDTVQMLNANTVEQRQGLAVVSETVVTPASSHHEVGEYPATLNSLTDGLPTTLSDADGPLGPTDATWAFQWDFTIPGKGTVQISKDKRLAVPEPATLGFLVLSGALTLLRRK